MEIQRLHPMEVDRFKNARLRALRDAPDAFGTTFEDASAWSPEDWAALLSRMVVFVSVMGTEDTGMVRCAPDDADENIARLGSLWVSRVARGTGAGENLVRAVVEWARRGSFAAVVLDVSDSNAAAQALYDRMGFIATGVVSTFPPPRQHLGRRQLMLYL